MIVKSVKKLPRVLLDIMNFDRTPNDYENNLNDLPILILIYLTANSQENFNKNIEKLANDYKFELNNDALKSIMEGMHERYLYFKFKLPKGQSVIQQIAKKILNIGGIINF